MKQLIILTLFLQSFYSVAQSTTYFSRVYNNRAFTAGNVVELPDGYMVTGVGNIPTNRETVLTKLYFNGDTAWTKVYGAEPNVVNSSSMVRTQDGNVVVCFYWQADPNAQPDVAATKFSSTDGSIIWERRYAEPGLDFVRKITENTDGSLMLIGQTNSFGNYDIDLLKTDSSGNLIWRKQYGRIERDSGYGVVETGDGGYMLSGFTEDPTGPFYYTSGYIVRIDANGNYLWDRSYYYGYQWNYAMQVVKLKDGNYLLRGVYQPSDSSLNTTMYFLKVNPTGDIIWKKDYTPRASNSWGGNKPYENPDGTIVIGSWVWDDNTEDRFNLMKVDAQGELIWNKEHYYNASQFNWIYETIPTTDGGYIGVGSTVDPVTNTQKPWVLKLDCMGCNGVQCQSPTPCEPRPLGTADSLAINNFTLYPNPASSYVTLAFNGTGTASCTLYNAVGQTLHTTLPLQPGQSVQIAVSTLPAGVYIAQWQISSGAFHTQRLVVSQ